MNYVVKAGQWYETKDASRLAYVREVVDSESVPEKFQKIKSKQYFLIHSFDAKGFSQGNSFISIEDFDYLYTKLSDLKEVKKIVVERDRVETIKENERKKFIKKYEKILKITLREFKKEGLSGEKLTRFSMRLQDALMNLNSDD